MKRSRSGMAAVTALALLLLVVLSAFAAPDAAKTHYKLRLKNVNVPWAFAPPDGYNNAVCSYIPPGYHINPNNNATNRQKTAIVTELPNGTKRIVVRDIMTGTAHDNFGGTYRFVYRNNSTSTLDGDVVTVRMTDEFILNGPVKHRAGFKWSWQFNADNIKVHEEFGANGKLVDLWVDPFFWPDLGGTIPGTWIEHYAIGGGISCDPL